MVFRVFSPRDLCNAIYGRLKPMRASFRKPVFHHNRMEMPRLILMPMVAVLAANIQAHAQHMNVGTRLAPM
jgi:hypothetical protein